MGSSIDQKEEHLAQRKCLRNASSLKNGKGFCLAERETVMAVSLRNDYCCSGVFYVFNDSI